MPDITMPRLSDTMQEGTIARWLKQPGERVERGDVLAEIETDKATMDLEAYDAGVLERILIPEGQTVPIGQSIGVIGTGENVEAMPAAAARAEEISAPEAARPPQPVVPPAEQALPREEAPPTAAPEGEDRETVRASPMARAIARDRGIDLRALRGSGPGGRIVRADVEAAPRPDGRVAAPAAGPAATPPAAPVPRPEGPDVEEVPLGNVRRVIARRMLESVQSAPHFYLVSEVDAEALVRLRAELNQQLAASGEDLKFSLNDLLVKACAVALRAHPDVNVAFAGDKLLRYRRINIGVAVAVPGGLLVPVIRDVDQKPLSQIAREAKALIEKTRAGKLTPDDYSGGTFTISNLGMYGIDHFTAIINPPEAAILAVGATSQQAVVRDGQVVARETMKMTLSVDHRSLDGATAAQFLQTLKAVLENPLRMVV